MTTIKVLLKICEYYILHLCMVILESGGQQLPFLNENFSANSLDYEKIFKYKNKRLHPNHLCLRSIFLQDICDLHHPEQLSGFIHPKTKKNRCTPYKQSGIIKNEVALFKITIGLLQRVSILRYIKN